MTAFQIPGTARPQESRFPLALAASAGLHLLLTSTLSGLPEGGASRSVRLPLTVRLELAVPAPAPENPEAPARSYDDLRFASTGKETRAAPRPDSAAQPQRASESSPIPLQREAKIYAALELDTLPSPAGPIDIGGLRDGAMVDRYRVELTIDERGLVEKLAVLDPPATGLVEQRLRAAFGQARFFPARKDGRAVRSRVVLQIGFDSGGAAR